MSIKMKSVGTISALFVCGVLSGVAVKSFINRTQARQVASPTPAFRPTELNKTLAPLKVEIQRPTHLPESSDVEVSLTGKVYIIQDVGSELKFNWILPDGVSIVDGLQSDSLSGVKAGQTVEIKLIVTGFSREEQKVIALSTTGMQNGAQVGNSATVASRPEDTWEAVAPEMQRGAEEQLGDSTSSRRRK